jgi:hypothetical protein
MSPLTQQRLSLLQAVAYAIEKRDLRSLEKGKTRDVISAQKACARYVGKTENPGPEPRVVLIEEV